MRFTKLLPLVLCSALVFCSCDDDDNDDLFRVPSVVETSFSQQYPDATTVKWEKEQDYSTPYMKAQFRKDGVEYEAWYTYEGIWKKTETKYKGDLPIEVLDQLKESYAGYHIDEVKWVEAVSDSFFEIELEKGDNEIEVSILIDGTIIFVSDGKHNIPDDVLQLFEELFPGVSVEEWEKEDYMLKAEFKIDNTEYEVWFSYDGKWVKTESEFTGRLPQVVVDYFNKVYTGYKIDEMKWVKTPEGDFFEIEIEKGNSEITVSILPDGTVIFVSNGNHEIPEDVLAKFDELYPGIVVNKWKRDGLLIRAEFVFNNTKTKAWFTYNGIWVKSESKFTGRLPQAVVDYLNNFYAGYEIDDMKWIETPKGDFFKIEIEKGDSEIKLYIHEDGSPIVSHPDFE